MKQRVHCTHTQPSTQHQSTPIDNSNETTKITMHKSELNGCYSHMPINVTDIHTSHTTHIRLTIIDKVFGLNIDLVLWNVQREDVVHGPWGSTRRWQLSLNVRIVELQQVWRVGIVGNLGESNIVSILFQHVTRGSFIGKDHWRGGGGLEEGQDEEDGQS